MAKLEQVDELSREYVAAVRASWNGDLAFGSGTLKWLRANGYDQIDILDIVEDGVPTLVLKESAHATDIEICGTATAGARLRVALSYDPHLPALLVVEVSEF